MTFLPLLRLTPQKTNEAGHLISPLFTQEQEVSANPFGVSVFSARSSKRQAAAASIIKCGDFGSVSLSQHDRERMLSERKNLYEYLGKEAVARAPQGECSAQRRLSEAEMEMVRKSCKRRKSDIAPYETNQQLESQRLELYQASHWADQAQQENSR